MSGIRTRSRAVSGTMRALVIRAPMKFAIEDVPTPSAPEGGMLVEVTACALCGSDLRTLRTGHRRVTFPWTIGHEICGSVVETGPGYEGPWKEGDLLAVGPMAYCGVCDFCVSGQYELCTDYREIAQAWPGGFAQLVAVPGECVRRGTIQRVPDGLDPALAAISEPISSCINAQEKGSVGMGDVVAIVGSGPVGCIHAALAKFRGADRVFVIDMAASRLELAAAFQPDALIDASKSDPVAEVMRLTRGRGADVVVSASPSPRGLTQSVEMARKGGRVLVFGGLSKEDARPGVDMNLVHYNALHLVGTTTFAPRHQMLALRMAASERFPAAELISHRLPLERFAEGAALAMEGKALKAVFFPGGIS
jgi:L-iditol 2-dehydrogenase